MVRAERAAGEIVHEGADGSGPECSLCGTLWPLCGHHHMSHWEPVDHTNDPQETNA